LPGSGGSAAIASASGRSRAAHSGQELLGGHQHAITAIQVPVVSQIAITQQAAVSPSVTVSAAAAVTLAAVMVGAEVVRAPGCQARPLGDGASARPR
jgi:hypothetical protein